MTVKIVFSEEERWLLALLRNALNNQELIEYTLEQGTVDWAQVVALAKKHAVLSLLYDITKDNVLFQGQGNYIKKESRQIVLQSYRLLFLTKYVVTKLTEQGISVIVLKGVATGSMYPVPELRKSGDIDLLVPQETNKKMLVHVMEQAGFWLSEEQHANHHVVFASPEGISVEVHTMLAEPFAYKNINQAMEGHMKECWNYLQMQDVMGVELPILDKPFHAYELLLHMLQHFVYAGFGLKLLCDWVAIWRQCWTQQEKRLFIELVKESGLEKFAEALTVVCSKYLGLEKEDFAWQITDESMADEVLREILDAEDFGNADVNRMVMMSGTGITAYVKEFHHQMHLNFPKAGKCFWVWPVLWIVTLVRFLKNNRKVRNTSAGKVLKEAARRSQLMNKLKLFQ
ncbi:MAG: nucleotidyltransferase family protein [Lachnospiraceae bacterium]|nr:nucleotidyltransferase family protein [Lachnospiraceae bacterium]